jgi:DNA polymerase delta subunit 2
VFKQQPEKPSVLQELVEDNPMVPVQPKTRYISDKDVILLEDETTRVQLIPTQFCGMTINGLVNGIVCAVRGKPNLSGKFEVHDVIYATPKPSVWPAVESCAVEMV